MSDRQVARTPRRRLTPDSRRQALISAALELFNERSYDEVSADDIATAAGMSRPLLYHYYGGKHGVFIAALRQAATELLASVRAAAADAAPDRCVPAALGAYFDHVQANPISFVALVGHGSTPADSEGETIMGEIRESILDLIMQSLHLRAEPTVLRLFVRGWIGLVEVISRQWQQVGEPKRPELDRILLELFNVVLETTASNYPAVREALVGARTLRSEAPLAPLVMNGLI